MHNAIRPLAVIAAIVLTTAVASIVDPPDVSVNTVSGLIETVDAAWSGTNYNVRSTQVTSAGEQLSSTILTANTANDVDPRLTISPSGDVLVAWWRDLATDAVIYRKRALVTLPVHDAYLVVVRLGGVQTGIGEGGGGGG